MNPTSRLPPKLGRHNVVGHLATGGMAEVLLGRVVGPSGFERPVVLKRILPHLARQDAFIRMFLDEARIIARIRHPNVVQVQELVQDDGEVSMVMEYLEGENVSGIVRRLLARNETLPPSLAAHIVAEACAGLHAAHELSDDDGRPLGIVHRDVSPQNLFVTYDGAVKVIDFGVAIAHDRMARTETGQLKGKLDYMAPEHVAGKALDRRADVFALGVVLYELLAGRRLFKRANALATMKAICAEPIVPPSRLSKTCPPALERIAMRALERAPDERHATAAEMRRDLLAALRELDPERGAEEALASLMQRVFADRKQEKDEMLRRVRSGTASVTPPESEADAAIEIPIVATDETVIERSRKRPRVLFAIAAIVGTAALAFAIVNRRASGATVAAAPSRPSDVLAPAAAPSLPADVGIDLDTMPPGAEVVVGGDSQGRTPLVLHLLRGDRAVALVVKKPGFLPVTEPVTPNVDQRLRLTLTPKPAAKKPAAPKNPDPTQIKW